MSLQLEVKYKHFQVLDLINFFSMSPYVVSYIFVTEQYSGVRPV